MKLSLLLLVASLFAFQCSESSVSPPTGVSDTIENDSSSNSDLDGDGIVDSKDDDIDNDGIPNDKDDDIDGDGIPNDKDNDINGDSTINNNDSTNNDDGNGSTAYENDYIMEPSTIIGLNEFSSPIVDGDYCYITTYNDDGIAMLIKYNLLTDETSVPIMTPTKENAYIFFDANKGNLAYIMFDENYDYNIKYIAENSGTSIDITNDTNYREQVTVGKDYIACVDYRNLSSENSSQIGTGGFGGGTSTENNADSVNSEIYLYNINSKQETRLTDDKLFQYKPQIRDGYLVFVEYTDNTSKIKLYDLSSKQYIDIPQYGNISENPKISNGTVVWEEGDGEDFDIISYNIDAGERTVVSDESNSYRGNPSINNGKIVWESYNSSTMGISGVQKNKNEIIDIYNNDSYDGAPAIGENYMVWLVQSGDNYFDLYKAELK